MTTQQQFYYGDHCFRHVRTTPGKPPEKIQNEKTKLKITNDEVKTRTPIYALRNGKQKRVGWQHGLEKRKYLQCPSCFMRFQLKTK